jgi:hypothetical protein
VRVGVVCAIVWLGVVLLAPAPDLKRAQQQAVELEALIRQRTEYAEVRVVPLTNGKLTVLAPAELPAAAKTELEHLVIQNAPARTGAVSYLRSIDTSKPNSK